MTIEDTDVPDKFSLSEAPAEGDGYYQAKTRQWVDLCPHLGPSDRTVLRVLTDLTTHASNRRKVSLDDLRGFVTTNPVALGEEPKPISASGLLRVLRNLAALGQITADEDGTPLTFSSRKSAQPRAITMTIWRLPRHECGCHRNVFDALADVRGEKPRFEPARMDSSAVRRRTKRAGQKSNPGGSAGQKSNPGGQKSNPGGQKSNPGGQKVDPHSQSDQRKPAPPITPPTTLPSSSSSSGGSTTSPTPEAPGEEEDDDTPTATKTPDAAETVMARTDATAEEDEGSTSWTDAAVGAVGADSDRAGGSERGTGSAPKTRGVSGSDERASDPIALVLESTDASNEEAGELVEILRPEAKRSLNGFLRVLSSNGDLEHRLDMLRRQRPSEARAGASEPTGPDAQCSEHWGESVPCPQCAAAPAAALRPMLQRLGPVRRPDLARRLGA